MHGLAGHGRLGVCLVTTDRLAVLRAIGCRSVFVLVASENASPGAGVLQAGVL
jgi:hypothetical protein